MTDVSEPLSPTSPAGGTAVAERPVEVPLGTQLWQCIVWDDPVNLMSYVTYVFRTHFKYSREKAHRLMMEVHTEGRSVVASGTREEMERHVNALHGYGLWATMERAE